MSGYVRLCSDGALLREPRSADANASDTVDDPLYAALATVARAATADAASVGV